MHARTHTHTHAHTNTRAHKHTHTHTHAHTNTHARTHARTHTHTHTEYVQVMNEHIYCTIVKSQPKYCTLNRAQSTGETLGLVCTYRERQSLLYSQNLATSSCPSPSPAPLPAMCACINSRQTDSYHALQLTKERLRIHKESNACLAGTSGPHPAYCLTP